MTNKIGLNAYMLQLIAIIAMFLDHLAHIVINLDIPHALAISTVMNCIGRLTMPIMCYFVAEGYHKTSNLPKYMLRLFVLAIISQIPFYVFGLKNSLPQSFFVFVKGNLLHLNVAVTLFMGLLALACVKSKKFGYIVKIATVIATVYITRFSDWRYFGVIWILIFGLFYGDFKKQAIFFAISVLVRCYWFYISNPFALLVQMSSIFALVLLFFYNGEKGKKPKYGFYIFYPVHLLILGIVKFLIIT